MSLITEHNVRHQSPGPENGVWFDEVIETFVTRDRDMVHEILRSPDWEVAYREPVDRILKVESLKTMQTFDATNFAFNGMPLAHEGAHHAALRRSFAKRVAERRDHVEAALDEVIPALVGKVVEKGQADLVPDLVFPLAGFILNCYGAPKSDAASVSVSQVLDPLISIRRRKTIEGILLRMKAALEAEGKEEAEIAQDLNFQILGGDSLSGSLSASLFAVLDAHAGERLSDMNWPAHIPGTGVPYVARRAKKAVTVQGRAFEAGAFIRLYLRSFADLSAENASPSVFGVGRHVCVGKAISLSIWGKLTSALSARHERVTITQHGWRRSDYVFDHLEQLVVDVNG